MGWSGFTEDITASKIIKFVMLHQTTLIAQLDEGCSQGWLYEANNEMPFAFPAGKQKET